MQIKVRIAKVYGRKRIYPVCTKGKMFAILTGKKCLTQCEIEIIMKLGFEIDVEKPEI